MAVVIKSITTWRDRFWEQVKIVIDPLELSSRAPAVGACWEWQGQRDKDGYGVFDLDGKKLAAHRVGYEIQNGPIPRGHFVMHKCDNPPCVRGTHLGTGTNADNLKDMAEKGRARGGRRTKDGQEPRNRQVPA